MWADEDSAHGPTTSDGLGVFTLSVSLRQEEVSSDELQRVLATSSGVVVRIERLAMNDQVIVLR